MTTATRQWAEGTIKVLGRLRPSAGRIRRERRTRQRALLDLPDQAVREMAPEDLDRYTVIRAASSTSVSTSMGLATEVCRDILAGFGWLDARTGNPDERVHRSK